MQVRAHKELPERSVETPVASKEATGRRTKSTQNAPRPPPPEQESRDGQRNRSRRQTSSRSLQSTARSCTAGRCGWLRRENLFTMEHSRPAEESAEPCRAVQGELANAVSRSDSEAACNPKQDQEIRGAKRTQPWLREWLPPGWARVLTQFRWAGREQPGELGSTDQRAGGKKNSNNCNDCNKRRSTNGEKCVRHPEYSLGPMESDGISRAYGESTDAAFRLAGRRLGRRSGA